MKKQVILKFEHRGQDLLAKHVYLRRLTATVFFSAVILLLWLLVGMFGYHWFADLSWIDAFLNASMIMSGMGPVDTIHPAAAKAFAGFYAILSGVIFLGVFGLLAAPIIHRFLHRFHIDENNRT
ncbi:MAG: hypothetical protein SGI97_09970 [candidate division Zixibacteria bacterium]|nr:hypothetical protein [candidate division Zixibacteria bacterium]